MTRRRGNGLLAEVRRQRARHERHLREGERSLAQNLALAGVLGWTVVAPALLGLAVGRWVDRLLGGGVTVSAALLFAGVSLGGWLAWRRIGSA